VKKNQRKTRELVTKFTKDIIKQSRRDRGKKRKLHEGEIDEPYLGRMDLPEAEDLRDFESDPMKALMVYHRQSGLINEYEDTLESYKKVSEVDISTCVRGYQDAIGQESGRNGCAACGQNFLNSEMTWRTLGHKDLNHLVRPAEFTDTWMKKSELGKSTMHIVEHRGELFAVASELINEKLRGYYCGPCLQYKPLSESKHSCFFSWDYGRVPKSLKDKRLSHLNRLALMRHISYMVHIKLSDSMGNEGQSALKSHVFCSPHDGSKVLSNCIAVNVGCLSAFTCTVIADGKKCALIKRQRKLEKVSVDPLLSWQWLNLWKEAEHPEYVDIVLPSQDELALALLEIERQAIADIEYVSDSITILMESRMENKGDGFSALIPSNDINMDSAAQIAGIAKLVGSAERLPTTSNDESESVTGHTTEAVAAQPSRASRQTAVVETASLQATSFGKKDHVKYTDANGMVRAGVVAEGTLVYTYTYT
jgi:hypothetical protein